MIFFKKHRNIFIAAAVMIAVLAGSWVWGGHFSRSSDSSQMVPAMVWADIPSESSKPVWEAANAVDKNTDKQDTPPALAPNSSQAPAAMDTSETNPPAITDKPVETEELAKPEPIDKIEESAKPEQANMTEQLAESPKPNDQKDASSLGVLEGDENYSVNNGMVIDEKTGKDQYMTNPVPEGKPLPIEPQNAKIGTTAYICTLSVRCDVILSNMNLLDKEKHELVPEDGVIFAAAAVTFYEGESVFNVLQREMKRGKIHMEFENTPLYNSAYIEGINNLYEFDVGELSGWMYKVNGWFPNYGCSRYQLKDGDVVEWVYTCDLGRDVGGYYAAGE